MNRMEHGGGVFILSVLALGSDNRTLRKEGGIQAVVSERRRRERNTVHDEK